MPKTFMFMKEDKTKSTFKIWVTVLLPSPLSNKLKTVISTSDSTKKLNFSIIKNKKNSKSINLTEKEFLDLLTLNIKKLKFLKKINQHCMISN